VGKITNPIPVKLICGLIFSPQGMEEEAKALLLDAYGPVDMRSDPVSFSHTDYYDEEMGPDLERCFLSFLELIDPAKLPAIKVAANQVESQLSVGESRTVNIDPGYVASDHLVLATTKAAAHRPYLDRGIYAELTYRWSRGGFEPLEWTYPDYRKPAHRAFFEAVRSRYLEQLADRAAEAARREA
jgi:hypothetical protein